MTARIYSCLWPLLCTAKSGKFPTTLGIGKKLKFRLFFQNRRNLRILQITHFKPKNNVFWPVKNTLSYAREPQLNNYFLLVESHFTSLFFLNFRRCHFCMIFLLMNVTLSSQQKALKSKGLKRYQDNNSAQTEVRMNSIHDQDVGQRDSRKQEWIS